MGEGAHGLPLNPRIPLFKERFCRKQLPIRKRNPSQLLKHFFGKRPPHVVVAFVLVITFLIKPLGRKSWREPYKWYSFIDFFLLAAVITIQVYTLYDIEAFIFRRGDLTNWDLWMGTAMIVILLEATRRTVGWAMVLISGFFLAHTALSNHFFWIFYGEGIVIFFNNSRKFV